MATKFGLKTSTTRLGIFVAGRFNATMQNLVRLNIVAMATTFVLGAESNRLPAC